MKLYINSRHGRMIVQAALNKLELHYTVDQFGQVELIEPMTAQQGDQLKCALSTVGIELIDEKKALLVEKIKNLIPEIVQDGGHLIRSKHSDYISEKLGYDYTYISNLFSQVTGITLEHYLIAHRIDQVKKLLLDDELSLTQIAYELNYSSIGHLSNQFKKVTGVTPTFFKQLKYEQAQEDEVLFFNYLHALFTWSLSGLQCQYYYQSLDKGYALLLTNPMKTILWASRSFWTLTGYKPIDVVGRTPRFLQGPGTDTTTLQYIHDQLDAIQAVEAQLVNYRISGEPYLCHLQIEPLRSGQGEFIHFLAVVYEVKDKHEG